MSRQQRRFEERQARKAERLKDTVRFTQCRRPRPPEILAQLYPLARAMMMPSELATPPRFRAMHKMAKYLLANPLHKFTRRHQRDSWRAWPRSIGRPEIRKMQEQLA